MNSTFYDSFSRDVIIAGGGFAGIKAAYECAKAGLQVAYIINSRICSGGSFYELTDIYGFLTPINVPSCFAEWNHNEIMKLQAEAYQSSRMRSHSAWTFRSKRPGSPCRVSATWVAPWRSSSTISTTAWYKMSS